MKLLFVLDSSESVGLQNFTLEKEFIIRVINKMGTFSSEKVRGDRLSGWSQMTNPVLPHLTQNMCVFRMSQVLALVLCSTAMRELRSWCLWATRR